MTRLSRPGSHDHSQAQRPLIGNLTAVVTGREGRHMENPAVGVAVVIGVQLPWRQETKAGGATVLVLAAAGDRDHQAADFRIQIEAPPLPLCA